MAKKKAATAATATAAALPSAAPATDPDSGALVENLRTLNSNLIKEVRERREKMNNLQSQMQLLVHEHNFSGDLERNVTRLVLASYLTDLADEKKVAEDRIGSAEAALVEVRSQLKSIVGQKGEMEKDLERATVERGLNQFKLAQEEERNGVAIREAERLRMELASLEKDKERLQLDMEAQKNDYVKELDCLQDVVKRVEVEKDAINKVRAMREDEISHLQSKLTYLTAVASDLNLEKQLVKTLRLQIEELEKNRDIEHDELQKIHASYVSLSEQNYKLKIDCDALTRENASLDDKLRKSLESVKEMEEKGRDTNRRFEKVLTLIKTTSEAINTMEGDTESSPGLETITEPESDECINDIICKFQVIKAIFESKVALIKDRDEQLNLFRIAVEDARKKGALWTWLYPIATTVVAAISVAFAVKQ